MSKMKAIVQIFAGLTLGAAACLTMPDADAKTIPAAACVVVDPADVIPSGGSMWAANGDGQVLCPLQRAKDAGSLSSAMVDFQAPASGQYACWLYATDSLYTSLSSRTVVNGGSGAQTRDFNASLLTTYNDGYYYVGCNIPQGGKLFGVRFDEA